MTDRLGGKVASVTGGASGQGEAEATLFAAEGARVIVADVNDDAGKAVVHEIGDAAEYVHQGALDDQQINDLVLYLVDMSSENVPFEDNVCLNPDASERALEQNLTENGGAGLNPRDPSTRFRDADE